MEMVEVLEAPVLAEPEYQPFAESLVLEPPRLPRDDQELIARRLIGDDEPAAPMGTPAAPPAAGPVIRQAPSPRNFWGIDSAAPAWTARQSDRYADLANPHDAIVPVILLTLGGLLALVFGSIFMVSMALSLAH
jgi:hypothetical protein